MVDQGMTNRAGMRSLQFVQCDGGRSLSTIYPTLKGRWARREGMRFRWVQDCAVRAVSTACAIDYDHAFEILEAEDDGSVRDYVEKIEGKTINGWEIEPLKSWPSPMTRIEFPKLFPVASMEFDTTKACRPIFGVWWKSGS